MKVLLAILSCTRDFELEEIQRKIVLNHTPIDYRFFRGKGAAPSPDAVCLDVDDGFYSLPFKTQAMCKWAFDEGYDFLFKMDTDTYLRPERLLNSGFANHDYSGFFSYDPGPGAYASGGSGYWLSRRAMEVIAQSEAFFQDCHSPEIPTELSWRGEDLQVCWVLKDRDIHCHKDSRYCLSGPGPQVQNNLITLHNVRIMNKRERVMSAYSEWRSSGGR